MVQLICTISNIRVARLETIHLLISYRSYGYKNGQPQNLASENYLKVKSKFII